MPYRVVRVPNIAWWFLNEILVHRSRQSGTEDTATAGPKKGPWHKLSQVQRRSQVGLTYRSTAPGGAVRAPRAWSRRARRARRIALAGIIVRNSILLVDFIQLAEARGRPLREAVLEAGA
ncbi:MAG TPA: hypothetical protein VII81_05140 [Terriglobales bacterium]